MSEILSQASHSSALWRVGVQQSVAPVAETVCTLLQQFRPCWKVEVGEVHQEATLPNADALWIEGAYAFQHSLQAPMVWLAEDTSYSVLGIRQGILDYLLVTVDPSEVEASVSRVEEHWCARASHPSLLRISGSDSLAWREVVFFEASGNYTWAHLRGHTDPVLIGRNLKKLQSEVPSDVLCVTTAPKWSTFFRSNTPHFQEVGARWRTKNRCRFRIEEKSSSELKWPRFC